RRERTAEQRRRGLRAGVSGNERDGDAVARGDPDPVEARDPHSEQLAEAAVAETNEGSESRHVAPSLLGTPERPMLARGSPRFSVEAPSEAASAPRNELESAVSERAGRVPPRRPPWDPPAPRGPRRGHGRRGARPGRARGSAGPRPRLRAVGRARARRRRARR